MKKFELSKFSNKHLVLAGTLIEFFDLYLYMHFAYIISQKFLPPDFENGFLFRIFTYCQLYLLAPLFCLFFSYLGDRHGRRFVIVRAGIVMAVASTFIAFLPTYENGGNISLFLLLLLRLIQGAALSGEPIAANLFLIESSTLDRNALWYKQAPWQIAVIGAMEDIGGFFALIIGYASLTLFSGWSLGWRIPFYVCALSIFGMIFIRKHLGESEEYQRLSNDRKVSPFDEGALVFLSRTLKSYKRNLCAFILLLMPYSIVFYFVFFAVTPELIKASGYKQEDVLLFNAILSLVIVTITLFITYLTLKFKWDLKKSTFLYSLIGVLFSFESIWALQNHSHILIIFASQAIACSFISTFTFVMPQLLKTFEIVGRYTNMGAGWGIARIINFITIVGAASFIQDRYGLYGIFFLLVACVFLGFCGIWLQKIDKFYDLSLLKIKEVCE